MLLAYSDGFVLASPKVIHLARRRAVLAQRIPARLVKDSSANPAASGDGVAIDGDRLWRRQKYHHVSNLFGIDHAAFLAITSFAAV